MAEKKDSFSNCETENKSMREEKKALESGLRSQTMIFKYKTDTDITNEHKKLHEITQKSAMATEAWLVTALLCATDCIACVWAHAAV